MHHSKISRRLMFPTASVVLKHGQKTILILVGLKSQWLPYSYQIGEVYSKQWELWLPDYHLDNLSENTVGKEKAT